VSASERAFAGLMAEVMTSSVRFGHREHLELTWRAVRRHGIDAAIEIVSDGIRAAALHAGRPQKYNATVSRAWVELVAHHVAELPGTDFDTYLARNPALLDKRLLTRFYLSKTLASPTARSD
jgi:hypothetical protein